MRILLFSDLHAHQFKPYSKTLENGRNSRLQDAVNILDEIYRACQEYEVDGVLFGGDLFHARGTLQVPTFNAVFEGIAKIKTAVHFFGMLVGNHDQATKIGDVHACYAFDSIVTVMDKTQWYTFRTSGTVEDLHVYAIPYQEDKKKIEQNLNTFGSNLPSHATAICLAHLGVSGAKVGSNFVLISKDNPTTIPFTKIGFKQIFLGHYHQHQILAPNMRYIGATHQHNWGDVDQERGFLLWDTEDGESCSEPELILTESPKFIRVPFPVKFPKPDLEGNFVRVVYQNTPAPKEWKGVEESLLNDHQTRWAEQWIEPTAGSLQPSEESQYQPGMDFEEMIDPYVADSETDLDKNILAQLGKDLLKEAQ